MGHVLPVPKPNFVARRLGYAGKQGLCVAPSSPDAHGLGQGVGAGQACCLNGNPCSVTEGRGISTNMRLIQCWLFTNEYNGIEYL